ncbi:MAG TPA: ABC transporter ATP-binding protein [Alphaproteobacteria bacterium]|nr:ABC transporter ATP-binding protein [Alphaproteobacteria bacterium]
MSARARGGRLILQSLTKRYPGMVAVDGMDLEVESGEFITLLGPSGSGKTSTLMMIAGFTPPSSGEILIDDQPITGMPPERRNIGVVFQNYALFPHMTVERNVGFPLKMRGLAREEIRERVGAALDLVQLSGLGARLPRELSGGQQQRVALARALVFNPGILLMDEPLGALDKKLREQMQFELKRIHSELSVTVIYVTHDQEEALTMSDRVALINQGRIEQLGRAEELYERPASRFVAEFIGESNLVEGRIDRGNSDGYDVLVTDSGIRLPAAGLPPSQSSGRALLVLRPEKIALLPIANPCRGAVRGTVRELTYVGDFTRYRVELDDGAVITAKRPNSKEVVRAGAGETVQLIWHPEDTCVLSA